MEGLYSLDHQISYSERGGFEFDGGVESFSTATTITGFHDQSVENLFRFEGNESEFFKSEMSDMIKVQIASHPHYPTLVSAYIECRKIGAPTEMAILLEEISRDNNPPSSSCCCSSEIGDHPELDEFMESYCKILMKYKEELSKPFVEAATFLNKIESQLNNLCKGMSTTTISDEVGSSEEEISGWDLEALESQESSCPSSGDKELKEMLLRKYSGYLSSLRKEFLKKRKKGKLPKDARSALLDWWNSHYRWPYPTEEEKLKLAEVTGLDQKQINNWFINQRKRHWKSSEDMRSAVMEGISGSGAPLV